MHPNNSEQKKLNILFATIAKYRANVKQENADSRCPLAGG